MDVHWPHLTWIWINFAANKAQSQADRRQNLWLWLLNFWLVPFFSPQWKTCWRKIWKISSTRLIPQMKKFANQILIGHYWILKIIQVKTGTNLKRMISIDSSFDALHFRFSVRNDRMKRWTANGRKPVAPSIERFVIFADFHLKMRSDPFELKRCLIERSKSYRLMCLPI